ncbi:hypothetical protein H6P81_004289 [Aristolochia fimbriata]|uniref:Uncharacterized protein n=1 Tax=Aristolochia fimbriata TaxID=158543 RepID=A0AAV7FHR2_ARIFI|nr:hypothetical protein H6P81_004289 [Aristolochia fimbriata]
MALSGDMEDFSASQTVVWFDPPVPLLRGPVPSGLSDNPSVGPFVLAFRDDRSWRSAFHRTQSKCIQQCEWILLEREKCEEREMSSCLVAARESCIQFAKDKCIAPFRDARIAVTSSMYTGSLPKTATQVTNYRGSVLLDNDSGDNMQK